MAEEDKQAVQKGVFCQHSQTTCFAYFPKFLQSEGIAKNRNMQVTRIPFILSGLAMIFPFRRGLFPPCYKLPVIGK